MLTELGVDWLAFELIEGVHRGKEPVETESVLELARQRARRRDAEKSIHRSEPSAGAQPILDDDQLVWAVRYVDERLEATLREMSASLDALDEIVLSGGEDQAQSTEASSALVLFDTEEYRQVDHNQVETAKAQIPKLRQALQNWLASARSDQG